MQWLAPTAGGFVGWQDPVTPCSLLTKQTVTGDPGIGLVILVHLAKGHLPLMYAPRSWTDWPQCCGSAEAIPEPSSSADSSLLLQHLLAFPIPLSCIITICHAAFQKAKPPLYTPVLATFASKATALHSWGVAMA